MINGAPVTPGLVEVHQGQQSSPGLSICTGVDRVPVSTERRAPNNRRPAYLSALMDLIEAQIGMLNGTHSLGHEVLGIRAAHLMPSTMCYYCLARFAALSLHCSSFLPALPPTGAVR